MRNLFITVLFCLTLGFAQNSIEPGNDAIYDENVTCGTIKLLQKFKDIEFQKIEPTLSDLQQRGKINLSGEFIQDYVGQETQFWVYNDYTGNEYQMTATCQAVGQHCYVYVGNDDPLNQSVVDNIKNEFDNKIYNQNRAIFGSEWSPGIDGDTKITILVYDIRDDYYYGVGNVYIAGYFSPWDETTNTNSNRREMFYMDSNPATAGSQSFYATLAHEFQHMIHYNMDANESLWLNEGCSSYAQLALGYPRRGSNMFLADPNNNLTTFTQYVDYEKTALFVTYLADQFGDSFINSMVANSSNSTTGINQTLTSTGAGRDFNQVFTDWLVANYLDDTSIYDGQYGYSLLSLSSSNVGIENTHYSYPANGSGYVQPWASEYNKLNNGDEQSVSYSGPSSGIVIKTFPGNVAVEEFSNSIDLIGFGSTYDQVVLVAKGESSSGNYNYSVEGSSSTEPNLIFTSSNNAYFSNSSKVLSFINNIQNGGDEDAGGFEIHYFVSQDQIINGSDYHVGSKTIASMDAGQQANISFNIDFDDLLSPIPDGTYYAGVIIDYNNDVSESNESDNTWVNTSSFTIETSTTSINVWLGNISAGCAENSEFTVAINVDDVTGQGVYSFGFALEFDQAEIAYKSATAQNSISSYWGPPTVTNSDGVLVVASAGASVLSGNGVLLNLTFETVGSHTTGETTTLSFNDFQFNEGEPQASTSNGTISFQCDANVSGQITYYQNDVMMPNVSIQLSGGEQLSVVTDASGQFKFNGLELNQNYQLGATKTGEPANSVIGSFDASFILRYFVNTLTLTQSQMIAADVSGNGEVTPFDASIILRYSVGQDVSQYPIGDWFFVVPPVSDWLNAATNRSYSPLTQTMTDQDFSGILIGDVSGNWTTSLQKQNMVDVAIGPITKNATQHLIPFYAQGVDYCYSYSVELEFENKIDVQNFTFIASESDALANVQQDGNRVKIAVANSEKMDANNLGEFYYNGEKPAGSIKIVSASVDDRFNQDVHKTIQFENTSADLDFDLFANYPNPFNPATKIVFNLREKQHVQLNVYDLQGRWVDTLVNSELAQGSHSILWNADGNPAGTYFIKLQTARVTKIRKCVYIK